MDLFAIKCETCGALLQVREMSAIGEVLECPRCRSFVEITPPPGWKPPPPEARPAQPSRDKAPRQAAPDETNAPTPERETPQRKTPAEAPAARETNTSDARKSDAPKSGDPKQDDRRNKSRSLAAERARLAREQSSRESRPAQSGSREQGQSSGVQSSKPSSKRDQTQQDRSSSKRSARQKTTASAALGSMAAAGLDLESTANAQTVHEAAQGAAAESLAQGAVAQGSVAQAGAGGLTSGKLIALAGGGLVLAAAIIAGVYFFAGSSSAPPDKPPVITPAGDTPPVATPPRRSVYVALNEAWLPTETQMIVSLQWSGLTRNAQFAWLQQKLHPAVGQELENICATFGVNHQQINRASWAVTQVATPGDGDVWMIELSEGIRGQDDLFARAEPLDFALGAYQVYKFAEGEWTTPFAIIDRRQIVTGDESVLRELSTREASSVASDHLKNLLQHVGVARDLTVLADLHALRAANVNLPAAWIESWGAVGTQWDLLRSGADGVALGLDFGNLLVVQVDFLAATARAHDVQMAAEELLAAADPWMANEKQSLQERLREGEFNDRVARQINILLERGLDALSTCVTGVETLKENDKLAMVWIRARTDEQLSELASAAISSVPAWEARRLDAARALDKSQLQSLIRGLRGYEKVSGSFPQGAAGTSAVPAERRLSWIAQLLPYYETQLGWKDQLSFSRPWNVPPNDPIARRPLMAVINPALGVERTAEGYPVTHYVGVAGVGPDAARLPVGDPNAGVFGYDRKISLADLQGNASQTMAIAGVSRKLGPWAAGGESTVRGFTAEPYINGPDGFGSGQEDGMFAAMADGSVRFLDKDTDPQVLRQLAVVGGPKPEPPEVAVAPENVPDRGNPAINNANPPGNNNANNNPAIAENVGPPPNADVHREIRDRLAFPLQSATFKQKPLQEVVDFLAAISGLTIKLDEQQLAAVGTSVEHPVTLNLTSTNIAEVLDRALTDLSLGYEINGEELLITSTSGPLSITQQMYDLSGLAETDAGKTALEDMLHTFVTPQQWDVANGPAAIGILDQSIVINHTRGGHAEVAQFLGRLRSARGLPGAASLQARTWLPVKLATLRERSSIARGMPVTANFFQPTPLLRIVSNLAEKSQTEILLDAPALRSAGVEVLSPVELKTSNIGLEQALQQLAEPLGLAVVALDDRTLQLTSSSAAESARSTEFFPLSKLLAAGQTPDSVQLGVLELLSMDASAADAPAMHYDAASGHLVVRGSQAQLFAIEEWLEGLAAGQ